MERLKQVFEPNPKKPKFITDFIETAMQDGAHEKEKRPESMTEACWNELMDIGLLYNMGPETAAQSVGELYGHHRLTTINKSRRFLINLHKNSSQETKGKFKLAKILYTPNFDRSKFPQVVKERMSVSKGGKSAKLKALFVNESIRGYKELREASGSNAKQMTSSRTRLKVWGIDLPRLLRDYGKIVDEIAKENDDKKLQKILDGLPGRSITAFTQGHKDQKTFLYVGNLLKELGFKHKDAHAVGERLRNAEIPMKQCVSTLYKGTTLEHDNSYWIVLNKRREKVIDEINKMFIEGKIKKPAVRLPRLTKKPARLERKPLEHTLVRFVTT